MRKSIYLVLAFVGLMCGLSSCFKDKTVDYSDYNDCALTALSLKDIEWSDTVPDQYGNDSVYSTKLTGTDYPFTIDQVNGLIYNTDSLPKGTPVKKILLNVTADGNAAYQRNNSSDDSYYYLANDTIDFSQPIHATVFSLNGNYSKKYTITLNVHQQDGDESQWNLCEKEWAGKDLEAPRAVTYGNRVAVFGQQNGKLMVTTAFQSSQDFSTPVEVAGVSSNASYDNVVYYQNALYMLDKETLYVSDDAVNWTQMQTNTPISHLMGCNTTELFGVYGDTFITSTDANAWNTEYTEFPEYIPDSNIFSITVPYSTNLDLERTVTFGQQKESTDTIATAWYRDNGYQEGYSNLWGYIYTSRDNNYALPNLDNLVVMHYKKYLIAIGNNCRNKGFKRALDYVYVSKDWGLTWKAQKDEKYDTYLTLPSALYRNQKPFAAYVDKDYNVWILLGESGEMWYGYLNKMKFAE